MQTTSASVAELLGDYELSLVHSQAAESVSREAGLGSLVDRSSLNLGYLASRQPDAVKALSYYLKVLHSEEVEPFTRIIAGIYLGNLFGDRRQWGLALFYIGQALLNPTSMSASVEAATRGHYAELLARLGESEAALVAITRAT